MQQLKDYYQVLGLAPDVPQDEVKRAYRRLAMQHHPDRNMDDPSGERLKEINEAYRVLGDQAKRRAYDQIRIRATDRFADADVESIRPWSGGWDVEMRGRRFCGKKGFGRGRCRRWQGR
jgi:curved DNA-binding protein CbpA